MTLFSPTLFFFLSTLSLTASALPHTNNTSSNAPSDAIWLLHFKSSISKDPSSVLSTWNFNMNPNHCNWYGVTCDDDQRSRKVVSLNLSGAALEGKLSAFIGNLTELKYLSLSSNALTGVIPSGFCDLHSLGFLNLSNNLLGGEIPSNLIGNGMLKVIDLSYNKLNGTIFVQKCEFLSHLRLSHNGLVGRIPVEIGRCKNLRTLLVNGNNLDGSIPREIGSVYELRVLDVSRNSLSHIIPKELVNCGKLSVLVLTDLDDEYNEDEFNAFDGDFPHELFLLPSLQILWAPRANLHGQLLPGENRSDACSMRVLNLGQNYFGGVVPESLSLCKNMSFLDLSSNNLAGYLPASLSVPCMVYFNISSNNISGGIPAFDDARCFGMRSGISYGVDSSALSFEDVQVAYSSIRSIFGSLVENNGSIVHDFSWNNFTGPLPSFALGDEFLTASKNSSYTLLLNNNMFNGSLRGPLVTNCNALQSFSVNLTSNQISGEIQMWLVPDCEKLEKFDAAYNKITGSISPATGKLSMLQRLDLRGNRLSGSLPDELGKLQSLKWILLSLNNLTGYIPPTISQLSSLLALDLSQNDLVGPMPLDLANASNLGTLLLDHNKLSGRIPSTLSTLVSLTSLDLSFNNLSGDVPQLKHQIDCDYFRGNPSLKCLSGRVNPADQKNDTTNSPVVLVGHKRMRTFIVAMVVSASSVLGILAVIAVCWFARKKMGSAAKTRKNVLVTFADAPSRLDYDTVVQATGNFSIQNLIGSGGFGSTYKAEVFPGYVVAVKRLSIGRFQGVKQFDAEIKTLGRVRHKNLVTLIGYYVGKEEMFLIYNYLSGGNLETFIHDRSGKNVHWLVICKIAIDIARALSYLHYACVPRIVHRDIKPSNILLDQELNAYLSDFGLARLLEVSQTHATTDVAGTFGYVAPEYATTRRVSDKADVYSFGIVLLELMSGKKSLDPSFSEYGNGFNIVTWARLLIKEGRFSELFAPELWEAGPQQNLLQMLKLASTCTAEALTVRPSMKQVLDRLKQLKS